MRHIYSDVITAEVVAAHLGDPDWVVLDCRCVLTDPSAGRAAYDRAHVPGAHYADLAQHWSGPITPHSGRHPLPDWRKLAEYLGAWGVNPQTQVVLYDDVSGAIAARGWWLLHEALGHRAVAVLDGGWPAWCAAGYPVSDEYPAVLADAVYPVQPHVAAWLETSEVVAALAERRIVLLDARAASRYRGETEPIDAVAGHIPGARNWPYTQNLTEQGFFRDVTAWREDFLAFLGTTPPECVVHQCGSGVTACHNLLAMTRAGLTGSRLYVGSWSEWIRDPARPLARGAD